MESHWIFIRFTIAFYLIHVLGGLIQNGMFLDGVTYAAISRNLAHGIGSYWDLHYTKILAPHFHDHPALVFILQSSFFKVLGDSFYTERIYSFVISLFSMAGFVLCWRAQAREPLEKSFAWLPVLLWLIMPLTGWSIRNNLLENTMSFFSLLAVFGSIRAMQSRNIMFLWVSSVMLIFSFLSKGFAGLFPLAVPVIYGFIYSERALGLRYFLYQVLIFTGLGGISLYMWPAMGDSLLAYVNQQVWPALQNRREITTDSHLMLLWKLLAELAFPAAVLFIVYALSDIRTRKMMKVRQPGFLLFIIIGICASLPLLFILKQRRFYLGPSLPYYALAFSYVAYPMVSVLLSRITKPAILYLKYAGWILITGALLFVYSRMGRFGRDKEKLEDVYTISSIVEKGGVVTAPNHLCFDWSLVAYLSRFGYISLDEEAPGHDYVLVDKAEVREIPGYVAVPVTLHRYILYKKTVQVQQ